jgi:hypothetical protein
MKLIDAHRLLSEDGVADHARYFNDLFKLHEFKETDELKAYFDFVLHEPELWLKSFPSKLKSKPAFSKPKTAILKLLRHSSVIDEYGKHFCEEAHNTIDGIYKKMVESILETRKETKSECTKDDRTVMEKEDDDYVVQPIPNKISHIIESAKVELKKSDKCSIVPQLQIEKDIDVESIESIESIDSEHIHIEHKPSVRETVDEDTKDEYRELQKKYRVLKKAYEELAKGTLNPSVVSSIQTILSMI